MTVNVIPVTDECGEVTNADMLVAAEGVQLYCDDLVTDEKRRSTGIGHALIQYMERVGRDRDCDVLALDSGTQRQQAHKFYFREGLPITSFHFGKKP